MIELGPLAILRPWWLLAIPLILVGAHLMSKRVAGLAAWERAIDPLLMTALRHMGAALPGSSKARWMAATLAALIALALSGPATLTGDLKAFRNLDGLVIAADLSRSVTESGNLPHALSAARLVAASAGSRPIALVVYGQDAYEASGFTIDARALGTTIALLDGETVPGAGSNPSLALSLAAKLLAESHTISGDVVLVSDGGGFGAEALSAVQEAATKGTRISALYVPHDAASPAPPANPAALQSFVAAGHGAFADISDPTRVVNLVGTSASTRLAATEFAVLAWTDHGRWLLILALLAALPLFRRQA